MMKFREYLNNLNKFAQENPDALDLDVVTSSDDEGNGYNYVYYTPSKGHMDDNRDFLNESQFEDYESPDLEVNAVCVN